MGANGPGYTELDQSQVLRQSFDEAQDALRTLNIGGSLVPSQYDDIVLTYVASGNGTGEIQTVTYSYLGGSVATLTLSYDASDRLIHVVRS